MANMHIFVISSMFVKLSEEHMRSSLAVVNADLSNRVVVLLSDEMLKALDDWRWQHQVSSRGEAVRQMVAEKLGQARPPKRDRSKPSK